MFHCLAREDDNSGEKDWGGGCYNDPHSPSTVNYNSWLRIFLNMRICKSVSLIPVADITSGTFVFFQTPKG